LDRSIIIPSRSGTYVVATLRQLLDKDVAPETHCNKKATIKRAFKCAQLVMLVLFGNISGSSFQLVCRHALAPLSKTLDGRTDAHAVTGFSMRMASSWRMSMASLTAPLPSLTAA
jgi:hypothetical protein